VSDIDGLPATDLVWGCAAIGRVINRTGRQTYHMLERGLLPAKKIGARWVASRRKLLEAVVGEGQR
jgi:hypothetical protein